ncbi:DUF1285 domain-containing protein [Shewanella sp. UCD-KL21]|uniref:DUF1285 domain-containing protein n=1 Tax=Shewanella sp. UCD-KL21 TaxID=1917164 RepID=UPI0009FB2E91|nr:DUF1285 domain-containing protein [Shewanella sp. UCD-KL21]
MTKHNNEEPLSIASQLGAEVDLCSTEPLFDIDQHGDWSYLASPLPTKFAKLFASVLHCIDNEYFLITPVEKVKVSVETHAIFIVDYEPLANNGLTLISSIGTEHQIADIKAVKLLENTIEVPIERGIIACLGRACYYRYINQFVID